MRRDRGERHRGQAGQSLIEVVIAVVLIGLVFLAVAAGMLTVMRGNERNEDVQATNAALVTYGEILQTQVAYKACPANLADDYQIGYVNASNVFVKGAAQYYTSGNGPTDLWRRPANIAVGVVSVKSWNPTTQAWNGSCAGPDSGVQLIKYRVAACPGASEDPSCAGGSIRYGEVVKRKAGPS